ncbi:hypothetical protein BDD12DRAFT_360589 [Trichophaea hybrida]|nr:hypothetical protein BDD12DRAFT_360589 [Trichophaea hybrida]
MAIGHITLSTPSDQPAYATTAKVLAAQSTPEMKPHLASIDHTMVDRMVYPLRKGDINPTTLIEALSHIRTILLRYKENYSWGTVLMVGDNSNWKPVPTAVLGFPQTTTIELPKDMAMDIIVTNDLFSDVVTAPSTWMNSVSVNHNRLNISGVSVGVTGLTTEASTFGGYVHTSRQIYGITAAHVAPAPIRSEICSPSTVELTARLRAILPYTNLDANPIRIRPVRQQEADNMITKYRRRYDSINGIETVEGKILLSGAKLGNSVANRFTYYEGIFQSHNSRLEEAGRGTFVYPNEASQDLTRSKLDWLLFEVNDERRQYLRS